MLEALLEFHRATLALKCEGLSTDQLRERAIPPSTLSLLGLIRHMAEVERSWFQRGLAGEDVPLLYYSEAEPDADFDRLYDADPDEVSVVWREECDRSRANLAAVPSLDAIAARQRINGDVSARWIVLHMIAEYARHNGHADLLRQRLDGVVGE